MKQPHDSKIGWQMLKRNLDKLTMLTKTEATTGNFFVINPVMKALYQ